MRSSRTGSRPPRRRSVWTAGAGPRGPSGALQNVRSLPAHRDRRLPRASGDGTGCQRVLNAPLPAVEQFLRAGARKFSSTEPPTIWGPTLRQTPVESNLPGFVGFVSHLIAVE